MYIPITQYWQQSSGFAKVLICLAVLLTAAYPIYTNYSYGYGVEQYQRHKEFMNGTSMFYNPWQYRILSPLVAESAFRIEQTLIERTLGPEEKIRAMLPTMSADERNQPILDLLKTPDYISYNAVFIVIRLIQHLLIFYLMFLYYGKLVKNDWIICGAVVFTSFLMANAVNDSDLSFNTYTDVILYLWAGYVIAGRLNPAWILLITVLGAFNRETSLLIPFIYFVAEVKWENFSITRLLSRDVLPPTRTFVVVAVSFILFAVIFVAIRQHYGYVPQSYWRAASGLDMLKLNLFSSVSAKSYFEMFGTIVLLPILFLYNYKKQSSLLQILFLALLPIWFGVHFWSVVAYQSRLFLVPTLLVLLPAFLEIIERYSQSQIERGSVKQGTI